MSSVCSYFVRLVVARHARANGLFASQDSPSTPLSFLGFEKQSRRGTICTPHRSRLANVVYARQACPICVCMYSTCNTCMRDVNQGNYRWEPITRTSRAIENKCTCCTILGFRVSLTSSATAMKTTIVGHSHRQWRTTAHLGPRMYATTSAMNPLIKTDRMIP
jgi:hypothetical protein